MDKKEQCQKMLRDLLGTRGAISNLWDSIRYLKYSDSNMEVNLEYARKMKETANWNYFGLQKTLSILKYDEEKRKSDDIAGEQRFL